MRYPKLSASQAQIFVLGAAGATWHPRRSAGFSPLQRGGESKISEYFEAFLNKNVEAA
jgi:hypothetical protein